MSIKGFWASIGSDIVKWAMGRIGRPAPSTEASTTGRPAGEFGSGWWKQNRHWRRASWARSVSRAFRRQRRWGGTRGWVSRVMGGVSTGLSVVGDIAKGWVHGLREFASEGLGMTWLRGSQSRRGTDTGTSNAPFRPWQGADQMEQRVMLTAVASFDDPLSLSAYSSTFSNTEGIQLVDLNNDGREEMITQPGIWDNKISIFSFDEEGKLSGSPDTYSFSPTGWYYHYYNMQVLFGDINDDGAPDAVAYQPYSTAGRIEVRLNDGDGNFGSTTNYSVSQQINSLVIVDSDSDGINDVVASLDGYTYYGNDVPALIKVFKGNTSGTLSSATNITPSGLGIMGFKFVAAADFNDDSFPDLLAQPVTTRYFWPVGEDYLQILYGNSSHGFDLPVAPSFYYNTLVTTNHDLVTDINGDDLPDLLGFDLNKSIQIAENEDDGDFEISKQTVETLNTYYNPTSTIGDFNNDGEPDLFYSGRIPSSSSYVAKVRVNQGEGVFDSGISLAGSLNTPIFARAGDLNGDGWDDLVVLDNTGAVVFFAIPGEAEEPTVTIAGSSSAAEGSTYTLALTSEDFGDLEVASWLINWGDGTSTQTVTGDPSSATHVFADGSATWTIGATVIDEEEESYTTNTQAVTVTNVSPTLTLSGNSSVNEGSTYTLGLAASDPGTETIANWVITWGDGSSAQTVTGNPSSVTHVFADAGATPVTRTISATATDEDSTFSSNTKTVAVSNVAPTLTLSGSSDVNEGNTYTVGLASSDPGSETISYWAISWGDGGSVQTVTGNPSSVTHVFADGAATPGTRTISATATDEDGSYDSSTKIVAVNNVAPTLTLSGGTSVNEGSTYTLSLAASDPGTETISKWVIAWDDDSDLQTVTGNPSSVTHVFVDGAASPGTTRSISATATDEDGTFDSNVKTVTVNNVAPTLTLSGPAAVMEGQTYTLTLGASDPGVDTLTSWVIDWDDESSLQTVTGSPSSATHVFAAGTGTVTVSATATDEDGTYDSNEHDVLRYAAPTVDATGASSLNEGSTYTLTLSASSGTDVDAVSGWTINWDDGTTVQTLTSTPSTVTHVFADGSSTPDVVATAIGAYGNYAADAVLVTVNNVAPTLTIGGAARVIEGQTYTLTLGATDPGADTIAHWVIDWDDASADQTVTGSPSSVTHVFTAGTGIATVSATATDEDGTFESNEREVVRYTVPTVEATGASSLDEGSTYTLSLSASDDEGDDVVTGWTINWNDGSSVQTVTGMPSTVTHVFTDGPGSPGSVSIAATAIGEYGNYSADAVVLTVSNVAPTLTLSGASSINEGSTYTLGLDATDPGTETIARWVITWGDGSSAQTVTGNPSSVTHVFADGTATPGTRTISATATDEDGTFSSNTKAVTVNNVAPTLTISGPAASHEGGTYTLGLGAIDPGTESISQWVIDWNDESALQTVTGSPSSVTHVFASGTGTVTVSATATDEDGTYDSNELDVYRYPAPTVEADGAEEVNEGSTYTLSLSATGDEGVDVVASWTINWDDGSSIQTVTGTATSVTHVFVDGSSSADIVATAIGAYASYVADAVSVTVNNVAPTLTLSGASEVNEGATYTLGLGASDPGSETIARWVITWGDGSSAQTVTGNPSSVTHVFADGTTTPGTRTISATATDEDGTYDSNTKAVAVNNVAPTLTLSGNSSVNEGSTYTLNLGSSDPGTDTLSSWVITWDDGSAAQTVTGNPSSVTHVFSDGAATPGTRTISATATDEDGTFDSNTKIVTVSNVAPTLTLSGPSIAREGATYTLTLGSSDPGTETISQWVIDWDDESALQTVTGNPSSVTHVFAAGAGVVTVTATATDEDGTFGSNELEVLRYTVPTVDADGSVEVNEGSTYTLSLSASGGTDTVSGWTIDWDDSSAMQTITGGTGTPTSVTHVFADGAFSASIVATAIGTFGTYEADGVSVTVNNVAPTLTLSGPTEVIEGQTYTLNLASSDPAAETLSHWVIDWDDASADQTVTGTATSVTHVFTAGTGIATVSATATDEDGTFESNELEVDRYTIPTVEAEGSSEVNEGSTYTLSLSASGETGDDAITGWTINWNDGTSIQTLTGTPSGGVTHVFADGPSSRNVVATAIGEYGNYVADAVSVTVSNVAPTLTLSGNSSVDEGSTYTLNLGSSDPASGGETIARWVVTWGDGSSAQTVTGNPSTVTHVFADGTATRTISATATDEDGTYDSNTKVVTVSNVAPTLTLSGNSSVNEGSTYTLNLGSSDPGTETISQWVVTWGDGSEAQTVTGNPSSVTHVFADGAAPPAPGTHTIIATAADEDGTYDSNAKVVTVSNVAPTLTLSGSSHVIEGQTYTLALGRTDPASAEDTVSQWVIDWDDESGLQTVTGTASSVTHVFAAGVGIVTVSATATDEDGTYDSNELTVDRYTVPTVDATGAEELNEGSTYTLSLSASDDEGDDVITGWTIDWNDGSSIQTVTGTPSSVTHVFADGPLSASVVATAIGAYGNYAADAVSVTVNNVDPTLTLSGNSSVNEGSTYTLNLGSSDPASGGETISQWVVTWGDGSSAQTVTGNPSSLTHVFADGSATPGAHTISATATDEDGTYDSNTKVVTVNNVAPTLTLSGNSSVNEGSTYTLNLGSSDAGTDTIASWVITWGDGSDAQTLTGNPSSVTHVFADGTATRTISATATDEDGTYDSNTKVVAVNNVAPTLTLSGDSSVNEGSTYTLNLSSADVGPDTISQWVITWGDALVAQTLTGNPSSVTHVFADGTATRTITATATDEDGTHSSNTKLVAVNNVAPTLTISGSTDVNEGSTYTLNLTSTDPGTETILKWAITWGDGSAVQTVTGNPSGVTHVFADGVATRTISATATDEDGTYSSNAKTIVVNNVSPTVSISGPAEVNEGATYTLNLAVNEPGTDTISKWVISWGDGTAFQTFTGNPSSVTHVFADGDAMRIIHAMAADEDGTYLANMNVLVVHNVAPTLTLSGSSTVNEGSTYTLGLGVSDPGTEVFSRWVINWGDGSAAQTVTGTPSSVTHVFTDGAATRTISATATDDDGTFSSNSKVVTVNNVAPTLTISGLSEINEGATYTLSLASSDPASAYDTVAHWVINWGDGSDAQTVTGTATSVTHVFADGAATPGGRTITATATDEDGTFSSNTKVVTVSNVAPTLTLSGPSEVNEGSTYTLVLASADPGAETISSWVITWGDGSSAQTVTGNPSSVMHVFADGAATRTLSASATDEDGTFSSNTQVVTVNNVAPTLTLSGLPEVLEGQTYTLTLSSSDPGADAISQWVIDWGDASADQTVTGTATSVTHVFTAGTGEATISATAADEDGTFSSNELEVVRYTVPTVGISGSATTNEGATYTLNLSDGAAAGVDVVSGWTINWNDGSAVQTLTTAPASVTHVFADGSSTASISATAIGAYGTYQADAVVVAVSNVAPTLTLSGPAGVVDGHTYTLSLGRSDPAGGAGAADTVSQWVIDWGDASADQTVTGSPSSVTHIFSAGTGSVTVSATATDEDGTFNSNELEVTRYTVPTVEASGAGGASVNEGSTYTLSLSASDETGEDAITGWTINWNDGTSIQTLTGIPSTVTHVFADGLLSVNVIATAIGEFASYAADAVTVTVSNVAPTLTISGSAEVNEGSTYTLNLGASDAGIETIANWVITWGDGSSAQTVTGNPSSVTHAFADGTATRTISATATDEDGTYDSNAKIVAVNNVVPTLTLTGSSHVIEGQTYTLMLGASDPAGGADTISHWVIDWGDVSADQTVTGSPSSVTHVFTSGTGSATVSATATDEDGTFESNELEVVRYIVPTVDADGSSSLNEGGTYTLSLSASDDTGEDIISGWTINWNDGSSIQTLTGTPSSVTHVFADGPLSVSVVATAIGEYGNYAADAVLVAVSNVAPTLTLSGNSSVDEGSTYTLGLGSSDGGSETIARWVINWGDDSSAQTVTGNPSSVTHVFADGTASGATRTISATATDEDGTYDSNTKVVAVNNVAPTLTLSGSSSVNEGSTYTLNLASSDPASGGTETISHWVVAWGDGSAAQTVTGNPSSVTHVFADGTATQTISATATDEDGTYDSNTKVVTVSNVAPTLTLTGSSRVIEGQTYTLTLGSSDPGTEALAQWVIDWDDESALQTVTGTASSVTHVFAAGTGNVTISATATDEDGTYNSNNLTVDRYTVPVADATGASSTNEGATYTLTLSVSGGGDGGDTITGWTINWNDGSAVQTLTTNAASATHVFPDGSHSSSVIATAIGAYGTYAADAVAVTVNNVAPTLTISGPSSVNKGSTYTLSLGSSDVGTDTVSHWIIDWDDESALQTVTGNPSHVTHVFEGGTAPPVTRVISATATDEDGTYSSNTKSVSADVIVASISGSATTNEGSTYTLALATNRGSGTVSEWVIDWGDGASQTYTTNPSSVTHVFADGSNTYTLSATATDGEGTYGSNALAVAVSNVAPTLTISGDSSVDEGGTYTLSLAATDPGTETISNWVITWGDGSSAQTVTGNPSNVTHVFADGAATPGTRTISATVTDEDGTYGSNAKTVVVNNVAPTLTISGASDVNEGSTYTLNLSSTDPGTETISQWVVTWGDGSATQTVTGNPSSVTHVFADGSVTSGEPGTRTISATATDEDGSYSSNTKTVVVNNVEPTLTLSGNSSVNEGSTYTLGLGATDPGSDAISKWTINWGDGSATQTITGNPSSVTHIFTDGTATRTISATATDEDGTYSSDPKTITVANVAPAPTINDLVGGNSVPTNASFTFSAVPHDPGSLDTFTYAWSLIPAGSTTAIATSTSATFTYSAADPGDYTLTVTVTDNDGASGGGTSSATTLHVLPRPIITIEGMPTPDSNGFHAMEGTLVSLTAEVDNLPGGAVVAYQWTVKRGGTTVASGSTANIAFTPGNQGEYELFITATNTSGGGAEGTLTTSLQIGNVAPSLTVTGWTASTINEGDFGFLSASVVDPGSADQITYAWTVTRGGTLVDSASTPNFVFTPGMTGEYTVSLTVSDPDGGSDTESHTVNVANVAPSVSFELPYNNLAAVDRVLTLTAIGTDPGVGTYINPSDTLTYAWQVTTGSEESEEEGAPPSWLWMISGSGPTITFTPEMIGIYDFSVMVLDSFGGTDTIEFSITVREVPELVIDILGVPEADDDDNHGYEGDYIPLEAVIDDADPELRYTYEWSVTRPGVSGAEPGRSEDEVFYFFPEDEGTYNVLLTVTNNFGDSKTSSTSFVIGDTAPIVWLYGDTGYTATEGQPFVIDISTWDPGADTLTSATLHFSNSKTPLVLTGSALTEPITISTPEGPATITGTGTVTNEDGTFDIEPFEFDVDNEAPLGKFTVSPVTESSSILEGQTALTFNFENTSDSPEDIAANFTYSFDGDGDGTFDSTSKNPSVEFIYQQNGDYTSVASITDRNGGKSYYYQEVHVNDAGSKLSATGANAVDAGQPYSLVLAWEDVSADGILKWIIEWGDGQVTTVPGARGSNNVLLPTTTVTHVYLTDSADADGGQYKIIVKGKDLSGTHSFPDDQPAKIITVNTVAPGITAFPVADKVMTDEVDSNGNPIPLTDDNDLFYYEILQGSDFNVQTGYTTEGFLLTNHWSWQADWGDGTITSSSSPAAPFSDKFIHHKYTSTDDYTVTIWLQDNASVGNAQYPSTPNLLMSHAKVFHVHVTPAMIIPAAPTVSNAVTMTENSTTHATFDAAISWTDNSNNESGFGFDLSTDGINFVPVIQGSYPRLTASANATSIALTGLTPATHYYLRVSALADDLVSFPSNVVTFDTPASSRAPTTPTDVKAILTPDSTYDNITIQWDASTGYNSSSISYKIEMRADPALLTSDQKPLFPWVNITVNSANRYVIVPRTTTQWASIQVRVTPTQTVDGYALSGTPAIETLAIESGSTASDLPKPSNIQVGDPEEAVFTDDSGDAALHYHVTWEYPTSYAGNSLLEWRFGFEAEVSTYLVTKQVPAVEDSPGHYSWDVYWRRNGSHGIDNQIRPNMQFYVQANYNHGDSFSQVSDIIELPRNLPTVPQVTGLTAEFFFNEYFSDGAIQLAWEPLTDFSGNYIVERSANNGLGWSRSYDWEFGVGDYSFLGNLTYDPDTGIPTGFVDYSPFVSGQNADGSPIKYMYRVTAVEATPAFHIDHAPSGFYYSQPSQTAEATPPPDAPGSPTPIVEGFDRIRLLWEDQSSNESGFEIQATTSVHTVSGIVLPDWSVTSAIVTATTAANASSKLVAGLAAGSTYYFRVRAKGSGLMTVADPNNPSLTIKVQQASAWAASGAATITQPGITTSSDVLAVDGLWDWGYDANASEAMDEDDEGSNLDQTVVTIIPAWQDLATAKIKFTYTTTPFSSSNPIGTRLWKQTSSSAMRHPSDYIESDHAYTFAELGGNSETRTVTLWLNSLNSSSAVGDQTVTGIVLANNNTSPILTAPMSSIGWQYVNAIPGASGLNNKVVMSDTAPTISLAQYSVTNVHFNDDGTKILGDITISGTVDDVIADYTFGPEAEVKPIKAYLNGASDPLKPDGTTDSLGEILVAGTRVENPESLLKPFDYTGHFGATFSNVELRRGANLVEMYVSRKIDNAIGEAKFTTTVHIVEPPQRTFGTGLKLDLSSVILASLDPASPDTIGASIREDGGSWTSSSLVETGDATGIFESSDHALVVALTPSTVTFAANQADSFVVTVTYAALAVDQQAIEVEETAVGSRLFLGTSERTVGPDSYPDYLGSPPPIVTSEPATATSGGEFNPVVAELVGPAELKQHVASITTNSGDHKIVAFNAPGQPTRYLAAATVDSSIPPAQQPPARPMIIQATPRREEQTFFSLYGNNLADSGISYWSGFFQGFAIDGLKGTAVDMWETVKVGVAVSKSTFQTIKDAAVAASTTVRKGLNDTGEWLGRNGVLLVMDTGATLQAAKKQVLQVTDEVKHVAGIINKFLAGDQDTIMNILYGADAVYSGLQQTVQYAVSLMVEVVDSLRAEFNELRTKMQVRGEYYIGRAVGFIYYQAVQTIATLGTGVFLKSVRGLQLVERLRANPAFKALENGLKLLEGAFTACNDCFVAGTPVITPGGTSPIEAIQVGDLVLSRNPASGEKSYKPVTEVFVTKSPVLYHVTFTVKQRDETNFTAELTTTADHPFYVVEYGAFVGASALRSGHHLMLADGLEAVVDRLTMEHAESGSNFTTYNLSVADDHTFFVGEAGVWVHNAGGNYLCQAAQAIFRAKTKAVFGVAKKFEELSLNETKIMVQELAKDIPKMKAGQFDSVATPTMARMRELSNGDHTKVFTWQELDTIMAGKASKEGLQNHHMAVKDLVKKALGNNISQAELDSMPGILYQTEWHQAFHKELNQLIKGGMNWKLALKTAYGSREGPNGMAWKLTQSWLKSKGL